MIASIRQMSAQVMTNGLSRVMHPEREDALLSMALQGTVNSRVLEDGVSENRSTIGSE
jgi:hypothetical protein